ncbi:MAG: NAD(P)H-dependent oxidoreductase, partial [Solobacterium sp.]|nr:NAD(P)H-dependent oxidoreductase [Solobacterium sp.]
MTRVLTAYFSASGVTARLAKRLAEAIHSDLYEIKPEIPYSKADLNWLNSKSRSSLEMKDRDCRPKISGAIDQFELYDVVFLGFPIWWYREPSIIDTFMESYDF